MTAYIVSHYSCRASEGDRSAATLREHLVNYRVKAFMAVFAAQQYLYRRVSK
jgi:hypothetical protein